MSIAIETISARSTLLNMVSNLGRLWKEADVHVRSLISLHYKDVAYNSWKLGLYTETISQIEFWFFVF